MTRTMDIDDQCELEACVETLLLQYPVGHRNDFGSTVGARLAEMFFGRDIAAEGVHHTSESALAMASIITGVRDAVIRRLSDHYGWSLPEYEAAREIVMTRRRYQMCVEHCGRRALSMNESFCRECRKRIDDSIAADDARDMEF